MKKLMKQLNCSEPEWLQSPYLIPSYVFWSHLHPDLYPFASHVLPLNVPMTTSSSTMDPGNVTVYNKVVPLYTWALLSDVSWNMIQVSHKTLHKES